MQPSRGSPTTRRQDPKRLQATRILGGHDSGELARPPGPSTAPAPPTPPSSTQLANQRFRVSDTRRNVPLLSSQAPVAWRGAGAARTPAPRTPEARLMSQAYPQFIALKMLVAESRRYAWESILRRHPAAGRDEVLVYQFNSTWCQLMDDVVHAVVERQVPTVAAAGSIVSMMELFQRHSPCTDLVVDPTPPVGPRHLPIDWFEAQRQDVRSAVVTERQGRKARAVAQSPYGRPEQSSLPPRHPQSAPPRQVGTPAHFR